MQNKSREVQQNINSETHVPKLQTEQKRIEMRRMNAVAHVVMTNTIFIIFCDSEVYEGYFSLCGYMELFFAQ